jgi:hypothetical protein
MNVPCYYKQFTCKLCQSYYHCILFLLSLIKPLRLKNTRNIVVIKNGDDRSQSWAIFLQPFSKLHTLDPNFSQLTCVFHYINSFQETETLWSQEIHCCYFWRSSKFTGIFGRLFRKATEAAHQQRIPKGRLHLTKSETRINTGKTAICLFDVRPA